MIIVTITVGIKGKGKWRQLHGLLSGLKEGATIGIQFPDTVTIARAMGAVHGAGAQMFATKKGDRPGLLWVTRKTVKAKPAPTPAPKAKTIFPYVWRYQNESIGGYVLDKYEGGPDNIISTDRVYEYQMLRISPYPPFGHIESA